MALINVEKNYASRQNYQNEETRVGGLAPLFKKAAKLIKCILFKVIQTASNAYIFQKSSIFEKCQFENDMSSFT